MVGISSLVDTWLLLRNVESNGERDRLLLVLKSRGSAHSSQVREFVLTDRGAELIDVYVRPAAVVTGSARVVQEAQKRDAELQQGEGLIRRTRKLRRIRRPCHRRWQRRRPAVPATGGGRPQGGPG
jgi:circadian clock protein KaiC